MPEMWTSFLSHPGRLLLRDSSSINQAPVAAHVTANAADIQDGAYSTCMYEQRTSERLAHLDGLMATEHMRSGCRDNGA